MGTIRPRGDKYQAIVKRQDFGTASQTFTQHKDALAWIRVKEAAMDRGEPLHAEKPAILTLASGLARYRDTITPGKKGAKVEFYRIGKWLADPLTERALDKLTAVDFATWRDRRLARVSGATVNRELSIISSVFDAAKKDWGYTKLQNPIRDIRKPPQGKPRTRRINEAEQAALLKAAEGKELQWFIQLAIATAMRRSELAQLTWDAINIGKRVAVLDDTKNGERRVVPLSGEALRVLNTMPRRIDGRLFGNRTHSFSVSMRNAVISARKQYEAGCLKDGEKPDPGFLNDIRLHDCRHEAVSSLFERGLDATEVASISGHKTMQMLARYTHHKAERIALKLA